ncbi:MAG: response regulator [Desulfobacteraceae bacterium]|nr:response regulator [Desulfobacteraceae bacterium]
MAEINPVEFIDELKFCLGEEDIVKAKALLQFASDSSIDSSVQKKALLELGKAPEQVAYPLLEYLTKLEISDAEVQESLYDLILDKSYGNTELVIKYISENDNQAKIMFIKAAGELSLTEAAPALKQILSDENDAPMLIQAAQSLGMLRLKETLSSFTPLVNHSDSKVRHAAIFAIAEIGGKEGVDHLKSFVSEDEIINKMAIEAIAEIQDAYSLETLSQFLKSKNTIARDTAIDQIMKLGIKAVPILTKAFENAEADYMVHLITTLGYIGDVSAVSSIIDIINTQPKDSNIRQAAYEAMERLPSQKSAICLAQGLQDPVENVRMSAARAIDQNLSKALVAGLKNIVREGNEDSQNAVSALIDSESTNIYNFLIDEESFLNQAETHLINKADSSTRDQFLGILKSKGIDELADKISKQASKKDKNKKAKDTSTKIVVVDDSKMMLKLYQNKLTALGYKPILFDAPEDVMPSIAKEKPDLIITDLNMPNISGVELTREIRKKFTRQDLPVIMITTQSDFIEDKEGDIKVNNTLLEKSGINKILHKPFTDEDFNKVISKFLG